MSSRFPTYIASVQRSVGERLAAALPAWFPLAAFSRFCLVALVLGIPGAGLLYLMVDHAGINYIVAGAINCLGMTIVSYYFNSVYTYRRFAGARGLARFFTSRLTSVLAGTALYLLLTATFGLWYLAASLLSAAIANIVNFALSHFWVWSTASRGLLRIQEGRTGYEG